MQAEQVETEKIETIHLYVVREGEKCPSVLPVIIAVFALSILIAIGVLTPYQQPEQRASLRVPAVPTVLKTFSAAITIIPTGIKTYPATYAHGVLTLSNGSVISQTLPAGFTVVSNSGVSVVTNSSVFVPAGNANGFGVATVAAHVLSAGVNLPTLAVDQVIGASLYIRNLQPFTGGHPAYSVPFATAQDKANALQQARTVLAGEITGLHLPCHETIATTLTWRCQFVAYSVPSYMHVTGVQLQGKEVVVSVWYLPHAKRIWVK